MQFPHLLFRRAGLTPTDIAHLCNVSRITGYRWLQGVNRRGMPGVGVNIFLQDRVARLVPPLELAIEAGALPDEEIAKLPPVKRARKLKSIISQYRAKK